MQTRLDTTKEKLQLAKAPDVTDLEVFRTSSTKLTWRGHVSLGLRKAMSIASASSFPQAALLSVSKSTVLRSEVVTGSLLISRSWFFHRIGYLLLKQLGSAQQSNHLRGDGPAGVPETGYAMVQHSEHEGQEEICRSHDDSICADLGMPLLGSHIAARSDGILYWR